MSRATVFKTEDGRQLAVDPPYGRLFKVGQPLVINSAHYRVVCAELKGDDQIVIVARSPKPGAER